MVFRWWGSERHQVKPGLPNTAHRHITCAKPMISCNSISQERSRKVACALTTAKTSGNDDDVKRAGVSPGIHLTRDVWARAFPFRCVITSPKGRTPVASKGSEGTASDTFCRSALTSGNAKLEVVLPVILTYRGKTREVALQTRRITTPRVHAVGRVRERHWTTDIRGTVEVEAAEL